MKRQQNYFFVQVNEKAVFVLSDKKKIHYNTRHNHKFDKDQGLKRSQIGSTQFEQVMLLIRSLRIVESLSQMENLSKNVCRVKEICPNKEFQFSAINLSIIIRKIIDIGDGVLSGLKNKQFFFKQRSLVIDESTVVSGTFQLLIFC